MKMVPACCPNTMSGRETRGVGTHMPQSDTKVKSQINRELNLQLFPTRFFFFFFFGLSLHLSSVARFQGRCAKTCFIQQCAQKVRKGCQDCTAFVVGVQIKSALSSCPPALIMVSVPVSITLLAKSLKSVSITCIQHAKFIYLNMRDSPGRWPGLCSNCLGCPISCRAAEGNLLHLAQVSQQLLDAMLELWKPGQRLWGFQFPSVV